jgi:SAM-dependent methyltransferase
VVEGMADGCGEGRRVEDGRVTSDAVRTAFDGLAPGWDAAHGPRSPRRLGFALRAGLLRDLASELPARRILDIGCGTGQYLLALAHLLDAGFGIDISPAMIGQARLNAAKAGLGDRLRFEAMPVERLEAAACGPFDLACFYGSLEHMAAPDRALADAARRLAPGGTLLVVMLHPVHPRGLRVRLEARRGTMPPLRLLAPTAVRRWAESAGLVPSSVLGRAWKGIGTAAGLRWAAAAMLMPLLVGIRVLVFRAAPIQPS